MRLCVSVIVRISMAITQADSVSSIVINHKEEIIMKVKHYNKFWDIEFFTFARNKAAKKAHNLVRAYEEHKRYDAFLDSQLPESKTTSC